MTRATSDRPAKQVTLRLPAAFVDVIEDLAEAEFRSLNSQIYRLLVEAISARKLAAPPVPKEDPNGLHP